MRLFTPTTRTTVTRTITTRRFLTHRVLSATRTTTTITTNHHGSHIRAYSSEKGTTPPSPLSSHQSQSQSQSQSSTFNPETYLQTATTTLSLIPPKLIPDTLHPTQSHLLSLALSSHLPSICLPPGFNSSSPSSSTPIFPWPTNQEEEYNQLQLPPGYHLIYYPLQTPPHLLFPDGTDADHCPGSPFTRRMWAGGRIEFGKGSGERFKVDGRKTICVETLGEPVLQVGKDGKEEEQRVWVDVWRRYFTFPPEEGMGRGEMERVVEGVVDDLQNEAAGAQDGGSETAKGSKGVISELRRLVFLREREPSPNHQNQTQQKLEPAPARVIRVPHQPDFFFKMTPDATLLFQFSALTFNAHAIHLNPLYAREVEGYKERLMHGPLTLVVMLRGVEGFLRGGTSGAGAGSTMTAAAADSAGTQISEAIRERLFVVPGDEPEDDGKKKKKQWEIANIEYKNLRPLFVGEEMKVCIRLLPNKEKKSDGDGDRAGLSGLDGGRRERVDVWIEAPDGGLAVKGTVGVEWR